MASPRMTGLDGREYPLKMVDRPKDNASSYHKEAVDLIKRIYPNATLLQEVSAKIGYGKTLYLDIYIPTFGVVVEVDGQQHESQVGFFHKDRQSFLRSKYRDEQKKEWCELNDIKLVRFKYNEQDRWGPLLAEAIN